VPTLGIVEALDVVTARLYAFHAALEDRIVAFNRIGGDAVPPRSTRACLQLGDSQISN
jgi:hypothetical protein